MTGIIWLASYPKSGNTWFRAFLSNLLYGQDEPVNINNMYRTPIASNRLMLEEATGLESSDLTFEEIDRWRPRVYKFMTDIIEDAIFLKVHDACIDNGDGRPLIPAEATKGAIYFIRNPFDVCVSMAHHNGVDIDNSILHMTNPNFTFCGDPNWLNVQFRQRLLTWSGHVTSWMDRTDFPLCLVRYEDMHLDAFNTFSKAVRFSGLEHSDEEIQQAIRFSSFDELKKQEVKKGFREKSRLAPGFFRKGTIGSWREILSDQQAKRIVENHRAVMERFGYVDAGGEILY